MTLRSNLILVTNNKHKLEEINAILGNMYKIESLADHNITEEIPETGFTLEDNALQKAKYVHDHIGANCFADDTGLEVSALNGEPGVFSARYAGEPSNAENNISLLLKNMENINNRTAQFRTVIALIYNNDTFFFEGQINGTIAEKRSGTNGFGYDSVFIPDGYECTFAELSSEEKNKISHRANATKKLVEFLKEISQD